MDLSDLNAEQKQAVEHDQGPILVVAGAGTGKTEVIVRRMAHLIRAGKAKPSEILAVTFTEKAAREMENRLVDMVGYLYDGRIMTFNAYGEDLLSRYGLEVGYGRLQLINQAQQRILITENIDQFDLDYFAPISSPERYVAELARYFSKLKNELIDPVIYEKYASKLNQAAKEREEKFEAKRQLELARAYSVYTRICRERDLIDFDDQILLSLELLEQRPNLLKQEQAKLKYILVDEFQDTNLAQSRLLYTLAAPPHNLMVVGDDDQSIYKFRGAAISNILAFRERYPDSQLVVLTKNYRSAQPILDMAYQLIQHNNPDRLEQRESISKHLTGSVKGEKPQLMRFDTTELEADYLATELATRGKKGQPDGTVAILLRKNNQAGPVLHALERRGVAYELVGQSQNLYQQKEIQYLLYFLQFCVDPTDSTSLYHLLAGDVFKVPVALLRELAAQAKRQTISLWQLLKLDQPLGLADTLERLNRLSGQLPHKSVGELAYNFLEETGYIKQLVEQAENDPRYDYAIVSLNQYFKTLGDYERVAKDRSAVGYVGQLPGLIEAGETFETGEADLASAAVQVMTVHRAKGLEFDSVYIYDVSAGAFPTRNLAQPLVIPDEMVWHEVLPGGDWHLAEERRLMYVAMTRAKKRLILTYSPDHGGKLLKQPSPFLAEAGLVTAPLASSRRPLKQLEQIELFGQREIEPVAQLPRFYDGDRLSLSVRQVIDYLECPAEFRWVHILQVPERPSPALMYGNIIHHVIQRYHQASRWEGVKVEDLVQILKDEWKNEGFLSRGLQERSLAQAEQTIRNFYARESATKRQPTEFERSFSVEFPELKLIVNGRFDAVYKEEETEVRDYKTGAPRITDQEKADKAARTNLQLAIYALAWQRLTGQLPDRLTLDFVDVGLIGATSKSPKQIQTLEDKLREAVTGIRRGDFSPSGNCTRHRHSQIYEEIT